MPGRLRRPPCQGEVLVMQCSSGKGLRKPTPTFPPISICRYWRPQPDIELVGRSPCKLYLMPPVHVQIHDQHTHTPRHTLGYLAPPTDAYDTGWWLRSRHRSLVPILSAQSTSAGIDERVPPPSSTGATPLPLLH